MDYKNRSIPTDAEAWGLVLEHGFSAMTPDMYVFNGLEWFVVIGWPILWLSFFFCIYMAIRSPSTWGSTLLGAYGLVYITGIWGTYVYFSEGPIASILYNVLGESCFFDVRYFFTKYFSLIGAWM